MNFNEKNKHLSEQEIDNFINSCPETVDYKQFMALVCLMAESYGFNSEQVQKMCMRIFNAFELEKFEQVWH